MKFLSVFAICVLPALVFPSSHADEAGKCTSNECSREEGCACSSTRSPIGSWYSTPQLVTLTFDDSINVLDYNNYISRLLFDRRNHDGSPVSATFYVPHKYTDYSKVNDLYNRGYDIGVNSITKGSAPYFQTASVDTLVKEFYGQRQIISKFANIPIEDIKGVRTPHFALTGDTSFEAYVKSELEYDNSWPTSSDYQLYPYTLDYKSTQECLVGECPTSSFPNFWVNPIINNRGGNHQPCNVLFECMINATSAEGVRDWLIEQFDRTYHDTKAPLSFLVTSSWFQLNENHLPGLELFLDHLETLPDAFLVSHKEVNRWSKNPISLDEYSPLVESRNARCFSNTCKLLHGEYEVMYMVSCVDCPNDYPWIENPEGN